MPSIGFNNPISGSYGAFNIFVRAPQNAGGAIRGYMPNPIEKVNREYPEFEHIRFTLKQAWNTKYPSQLKRANKKAIITPFRAVNNAGDLLSRDYYSCGGSCQTPQSRPNMHGLKTHFGSISNSCVPGVVYSSYQIDSTIPASACNTKFVYDSSDYIRFLKQQAINKNYNDLSYSGNQHSGSQSAYRAVHRY
jgi:hypothetical protein